MAPASNSKAPPTRSEAKAERTRSAILAAAEEQFARRGYAATRLDDVAEELGMTGAALFYYFRDKGALYDAMMERAFGPLTTRLREALLAPTSITRRIELAVEAWVDTVLARPALARLILRHIADAEQHPGQRVYPASDTFFRIAWPFFDAARKSGEIEPLHDHPYHVASAVIGSTIFYASALAPLVPSGDFDPLSPDQIAAHKRDALHTARRLLGMRRTTKKAAAGPIKPSRARKTEKAARTRRSARPAK
jgi:TetR/AcrR family transcriptional regulator